MAVLKQEVKVSAGPADYAGAAGFTVTLGDLEKVTAALVSVSNTEFLAVADTQYAFSYAISGDVITIKVFTQATVGGPNNAWATVAAHQNLSSLNFTILAMGE
jgi:hypothetical protein